MQATKPSRKKMRQQKNQPLDVFFSPKTVAVIGATENVNTVGRTVLWNLVTSPFGGTVYPVNPKRPSVLGVKAYKSVSDIPEAGGPGGGGDPAALHSRHYPGMRRERGARRGGHLGRVQGNRP